MKDYLMEKTPDTAERFQFNCDYDDPSADLCDKDGKIIQEHVDYGTWFSVNGEIMFVHVEDYLRVLNRLNELEGKL